MHENETPVTADLAAGLVAAQCPQWVGLPLRAVDAGGSDNRLFRLGEAFVLRFPRHGEAADRLAAEGRWLPRLAPRLPLAVPEPVVMGQPGPGYPYLWQVLRWIPGADALSAPPQDDLATAAALAGFVAALHSIPVPPDAPAMPEGGHLRPRDRFTRKMIAAITDEADPATVTRLWDRALELPVWQGVPALIHADLHPLNLLTQAGRLTAVIDWGAFCAGDPAHDLLCCWAVLGPAGRAQFRRLLPLDEPTWARGRALAFSKAVMAAPYYRTSNPALHAVMRRTLVQTIADWPR